MKHMWSALFAQPLCSQFLSSTCISATASAAASAAVAIADVAALVVGWAPLAIRATAGTSSYQGRGQHWLVGTLVVCLSWGLLVVEHHIRNDISLAFGKCGLLFCNT